MSDPLDPHFDHLRAYEAPHRPPVEDILSRGQQRRTRRTTGLVAAVMAVVVASGATYAATRDGAGPSIAKPPPGTPSVTVTAPPTSDTPAPSETAAPPSVSVSATPPSPSTSGSARPASPSTSRATPTTSSTSPSTAASTSAAASPAGISDADRLTTAGIGALTLGMSAEQMTANGFATRDAAGTICPGTWRPTRTLQDRGIGFIATLDGSPTQIYLTTPRHTTLSGARVGMTVGQVKQLYGTRGFVDIKDGPGGQFAVYTVVVEDREIAFMTKDATTTVKDTDVVTTVVLQKFATFLGWDGC